MVALLLAALTFVHVVDGATGSPLRDIPVSVSRDAGDPSRVTVEAIGSKNGYANFHGSFSAGSVPAVVRLLRLSADERRALERVNTFRARYGAAPLEPDENLTETARYWAREERLSGRVGHTCATLAHPPGCIEFNAYFHGLPGAPLDWFAGQNAAFDTISSWLGPESGFENERSAAEDRGHFLNLIGASRWIGLGEMRVPGYGVYFAMNLI